MTNKATYIAEKKKNITAIKENLITEIEKFNKLIDDSKLQLENEETIKQNNEYVQNINENILSLNEQFEKLEDKEEKKSIKHQISDLKLNIKNDSPVGKIKQQIKEYKRLIKIEKARTTEKIKAQKEIVTLKLERDLGKVDENQYKLRLMELENTSLSLNALLKQEKRMGYVFATPWLLGFILLGLFPFVASFYFGFTNYNMLSWPDWIGLENYRILLFNDSIFWPSLGNTLYHVAIATPLGVVVGVGLALLLNSKIKGISIYRTLFYLPNVVSIVAMSLLWLWLFQPSYGLINQLLEPIYNLLGVEPLSWYNATSTAKLTLILMGLWTAGGSMVIYLAQMQDIPNELYEAADIDGANGFQKIIRITLPLMTPSIFFNFIMGLIGGFQVFTQAYIMTGGQYGTYYYAYYLFDKAFSDNLMGMASAMAWILLVITLVITLFALKLNKYVFYLGGQE